MAGGFPLASLAGRGDLIDTVTRGVVHAGTFELLESRGASLADGLHSAFCSARREAAVHQVGPVVKVIPGLSRADTLEEFRAGDWTLYDELTVALLHRGIFSLPGGRWHMSAAHSTEDVEHTVWLWRTKRLLLWAEPRAGLCRSGVTLTGEALRDGVHGSFEVLAHLALGRVPVTGRDRIMQRGG